MADKEATVFVIDVGPGMTQHASGRAESNLEYSMPYVYDRITTKVLSGRKTDMVGVVTYHSQGTHNPLGSGPEHQNITIVLPIQQVLLPQLKQIQQAVRASNEPGGSVVDALRVGVHMISSHCGRLKYKKNLILITSGVDAMPIDEPLLRQVSHEIQLGAIQLCVLGVDFDSAEDGYKEENKAAGKAGFEKSMRDLCEGCDGLYATMARAIAQLQVPRPRQVRSVPTFRGDLVIGDPQGFGYDVMHIAVQRYALTKLARPIPATRFSAVSNMTNPRSTDTQVEPPGTVLMVRTYKTVESSDDEGAAPSEVEPSELEKGFSYGRTIVPVNRDEEELLHLNNPALLQVIGFVDSKSYSRWMHMSEVNYIVPDVNSDVAQMQLGSLSCGMYETQRFALGRLVARENSDPRLVLMAPHFVDGCAILLEVEVPFAEDVRHFNFAPFDSVKTVTGKVLTKHRNIPTPELCGAMDAYVDAMNLDTVEYGDPELEAFAPDNVVTPMIHRVNQAIMHRALSDDAIPPPLAALLRFAHPPPQLLDRASQPCERVRQLADIKPVEEYASAKRQRREMQQQAAEGLDVEQLLQDPVPVKREPAHEPSGESAPGIGDQDPIGDFRRILAHADMLQAALDGMKAAIQRIIRHSHRDAAYRQVLQCMQELRTRAVEEAEAAQYNAFVRHIKDALLAGKLGSGRADLWESIQDNPALGLVTRAEANDPTLDTTAEDARDFLR